MPVAFVQGDYAVDMINRESVRMPHTWLNRDRVSYYIGSVWDGNLFYAMQNEVGIKLKIPVHERKGVRGLGGICYVEVEGQPIPVEEADTIDESGECIQLNNRIYGTAGIVKSGDYSAVLELLTGNRSDNGYDMERLRRLLGVSRLEHRRAVDLVNKDTEKVMVELFESAPVFAESALREVNRKETENMINQTASSIRLCRDSSMQLNRATRRSEEKQKKIMDDLMTAPSTMKARRPTP
ncbi:MAG: hypothetical protein V1887_01620 [Candidatus Aenigmatarchaeota archaeon]